jgi:hypothetical protein
MARQGAYRNRTGVNGFAGSFTPSAFGLFKRFCRTVPPSVPPWEASVWVSLKVAPEATGYLPPMWAKPTKTKHTKTANAITKPTMTPTMM